MKLLGNDSSPTNILLDETTGVCTNEKRCGRHWHNHFIIMGTQRNVISAEPKIDTVAATSVWTYAVIIDKISITSFLLKSQIRMSL